MHTGEETASKPINQFREIIYNEGEFDNSDFTKPPTQLFIFFLFCFKFTFKK